MTAKKLTQLLIVFVEALSSRLERLHMNLVELLCVGFSFGNLKEIEEK